MPCWGSMAFITSSLSRSAACGRVSRRQGERNQLEVDDSNERGIPSHSRV
jgi:hypothetical protein